MDPKKTLKKAIEKGSNENRAIFILKKAEPQIKPRTVRRK